MLQLNYLNYSQKNEPPLQIEDISEGNWFKNIYTKMKGCIKLNLIKSSKSSLLLIFPIMLFAGLYIIFFYKVIMVLIQKHTLFHFACLQEANLSFLIQVLYIFYL